MNEQNEPPSQFFKQAETFIDGELTRYLHTVLNDALRQLDAGIFVHLKFGSPANLTCQLDELGLRHYEIVFSRLYIHKLLIFLRLIESHWQTYGARTRIFAFDIEHPYDTTVWDYPRDEDYVYAYNKGLRKYISIRTGSNSIEEISDFISKFNQNRLGECKLLEYRIDDHLTDSIIETSQYFLSFIVLHELFHITRKHSAIIKIWPYRDIKRRSVVGGTIHRYRHKAIECDADVKAFLYMGGYLAENGKNENFIQSLMTSIALGLSMFEFDRRNTMEVKNTDGLYPFPEIRFEIIVQSLVQSGIRGCQKIRNDIIEFCVRSFQGLGLFGGPFYLFSGPLSSLDGQLFKELQILMMVENEIKKIVLQMNDIFFRFGEKKWDTDIRLYPTGMTEKEYKEILAKEALMMFGNNTEFAKPERSLRVGVKKLAKMREEGIIRKGDMVISVQDQKTDRTEDMLRYEEAK